LLKFDPARLDAFCFGQIHREYAMFDPSGDPAGIDRRIQLVDPPEIIWTGFAMHQFPRHFEWMTVASQNEVTIFHSHFDAFLVYARHFSLQHIPFWGGLDINDRGRKWPRLGPIFGSQSLIFLWDDIHSFPPTLPGAHYTQIFAIFSLLTPRFVS